MIKGADKLTELLKTYAGKFPAEVDAELSAGADDIRGLAVTLAPVGVTGQLRNKIIVDHKPGRHEIVADVFYAPYVEFGTGKKVNVPSDLTQYALQFKGPAGRGGKDDFMKSLTQWVRRKGLTGNARGRQNDDDRYIAYWMMIRIMQNGIKPQPFFFRAAVAVYPQIIDRVEKVLDIK